MDAPSFTGSDTREFGPEPTCDQCGCPLYAEEREAGRCRRCAQDGYEADEDEA